MSDKTDADLGQTVINKLIDQGLMIRMNENATARTDDEKIAILSDLFAEAIHVMGYDMSDDELIDTPTRIAKSWIRDNFNAWDPKHFPKCTTFENKGGPGSFEDEMVLVRNIHVDTHCAHHFATVDCTIHAAYIPHDRMIGLSKLNKVVRRLARNPTSQETLGKAIATAISEITESEDVVVRIEGNHHCVCRPTGANDQGSDTVTMAAIGQFAEKGSDIRKEFNAAIGTSK